MNINDNIRNAFEVVRKTYESLDKLMGYLDGEAGKHGFEPSIERFLRYSSDSNHEGWLYNNMVKLYQSTDDGELLSNGWYDGPIYVVEFSFAGSPKMKVAKFKFDNKAWGKGIGSGSVNYFSYPLIGLLPGKQNNEFTYHGSGEPSKDYQAAETKKGFYEAYWNLEYLIYREFDLPEINSENAIDKVFGTFKEMKDLQLENIKKGV